MTARSSEPSPVRGVRIAAALGPLVLYLVLAILLTADAWGSPTTRWAGSCCDQQQAMWFLRWVPTALGEGLDPFVTDRMNAPAGVNLMWNSWIPLIGLAVGPVTLAGGPVLGYNVALVGSIAVSAWLAAVVLRRYAGGGLGPVVGGAVYGFSPYVASHAALHLNLVAVWAPPLALLLLDELLVRRRHRPAVLGVAIGVLAGSQLLVFEEILATGAVAAAILALVLALVVRGRAPILDAGRRVARAFVPALVTFAAIAAWPLGVQFLGPQRISGGQVVDTSAFATDLLNPVLPTRYQLLAPEAATRVSHEFSGLFHEATGYVGVPLLAVLVLVAVARWSDLRIRVATLVAGTMLVLSLGPELHVGGVATGIPMPWLAFGRLPLLEHAVPGRLTLYMWLAIAGIVAVVAGDLAARRPPRAVVGLVALGLAVAVAAPAPLGSSTTEVPAFFRSFDRQVIDDEAIVLVAPHFTNGAGADPMLWTAFAGNRPRLYEAYAYVPDADGSPRYGPAPTQLTRIMETIQDDGVTLVARGSVREQALLDIAANGITDVIVGPMRHKAQMVTFFTDLLGRPPEAVDGVLLWRNVGGR